MAKKLTAIVLLTALLLTACSAPTKPELPLPTLDVSKTPEAVTIIETPEPTKPAETPSFVPDEDPYSDLEELYYDGTTIYNPLNYLNTHIKYDERGYAAKGTIPMFAMPFQRLYNQNYPLVIKDGLDEVLTEEDICNIVNVSQRILVLWYNESNPISCHPEDIEQVSKCTTVERIQQRVNTENAFSRIYCCQPYMIRTNESLLLDDIEKVPECKGGVSITWLCYCRIKDPDMEESEEYIMFIGFYLQKYDGKWMEAITHDVLLRTEQMETRMYFDKEKQMIQVSLDRKEWTGDDGFPQEETW